MKKVDFTDLAVNFELLDNLTCYSINGGCGLTGPCWSTFPNIFR